MSMTHKVGDRVYYRLTKRHGTVQSILGDRIAVVLDGEVNPAYSGDPDDWYPIPTVMSHTEADKFMDAHSKRVRYLVRLTKAELKTERDRVYAEHNMTHVYGDSNKEELIHDIMTVDFPSKKINEAIHVRAHSDAQWSDCEWCTQNG